VGAKITVTSFANAYCEGTDFQGREFWMLMGCAPL
jgi:hypothetical protein